MDEPSQTVDPTTLRQMFNDGEYWKRVQTGQGLYQTIQGDEHIQRKRFGQSPCTHSQFMAYWDDQARLVAIVHQYKRADGRLGASERPDPKQLLKDGVWYVLDRWTQYEGRT
jgi:hypothetical protein